MKKNQIKVLALVSALLAISGLITAVYAVFYTTITSTGNKAAITSWNVKFNNVSTSGTTKELEEIKLRGDSPLSPGDEGTFTVTLENASDVDANYTIDLYNLKVGNEILDQEKYKIKFYQTSKTGALINVTETQIKNHDIFGDRISKNGGKVEVTIYWVWESGEHDNDLSGKDLTLDLSATLKQNEVTK